MRDEDDELYGDVQLLRDLMGKPAIAARDAPSQPVAAISRPPVFEGSDVLARCEAEKILQGLTVMALSRRIVSRVWHSGFWHPVSCQARTCYFRVFKNLEERLNPQVCAVLMWQRCQVFYEGVIRSGISQGLTPVGPDAKRMLDLLRVGTPLADVVWDMDGLRHRLETIAEAARIPYRHLPEHAHRAVLNFCDVLATGTAIPAALPPALIMPARVPAAAIVRTVRLFLGAPGGMPIRGQHLTLMTGGWATLARLRVMAQYGWLVCPDSSWETAHVFQLGTGPLDLFPAPEWMSQDVPTLVARLTEDRARKGV